MPIYVLVRPEDVPLIGAAETRHLSLELAMVGRGVCEWLGCK